MVETGKEEQKGEKMGDRKGGRVVWQVALAKAERNEMCYLYIEDVAGFIDRKVECWPQSDWRMGIY